MKIMVTGNSLLMYLNWLLISTLVVRCLRKCSSSTLPTDWVQIVPLTGDDTSRTCPQRASAVLVAVGRSASCVGARVDGPLFNCAKVGSRSARYLYAQCCAGHVVRLCGD